MLINSVKIMANLIKIKYMRKQLSLFIVSFFCFINFSTGQNIQMVLDPLNPFQKSSLFNLTIMNASNYSGQLSLKAVLKSRGGKVLMIQESIQELTANASKSIRGEAVQYTTNYMDNTFAGIYQSANQLPPYNYVLCIELIAIGDQSTRAEECIEYHATDFLNITSVYPPEDGEINEERPLFVWMNVDPSPAFSYDFRLVKLEEGQNPNAAMRRNNPLITMDNISGSQLQFPSDAPPLVQNEQYAWQLNVNFAGEKVTQTEPSVFTFKETEEYIEIPRDLSYVDINDVESGISLYAVGEFKFKVTTDKATTLEVQLFENKKKGKKQIQLDENQFKTGIGENKFELDLREQVYLKHLKEYPITLKNLETGKSYQFVIKYVNPDYIK